MVFPTVFFIAFVFEEGDNNHIIKLFGIISSSHMLVKMLWDGSRVSDPAGLKISAGRLSIPDVLPMLLCLIAFLASSKVNGRSRSSIITFCGMQSRAEWSVVDGLLHRLQKCCLHHSMMLPLSLSNVLLSEESSGVVLGYEWP